MDAHQQPGALDALIQDGLTMQAMAPDLEQLVHEGVHDMLGGSFNDVPLPSLGQPHLPAVNAHTNGDAGGTDLVSQMFETNGSGAPARPRRRAAAAAANFATDIEGSDEDDSQDEEEGDAATGSSGRPDGRGSKRRRAAGASADAPIEKKSQHMKGRFSGRLPTKDDERKLVEECQAMAPRLSKDGELTTLPTIIRAMAKGTVRAHLESEHAIKENAVAKLAMLQGHAGPNGADIMSLTEENMALKNELSRAQSHIAALEGRGQLQHEDARLQGMGSCVPQAPTNQLPQAPITVNLTHAAPPMQLNTAASVHQPTQQVVISTAPAGGGMTTAQVVQVPAGTTLQPGQVVHVSSAPETAIVMQEVLPVGGTQPVVVAAVQPAAATGGMLRVPSSAHLVAAATQQVQQQPTVTVVNAEMAQPAAAQGDGDPAAAAAGVAATNLNEHAQQLAVTAHLHGAAKTEAAVQAQQLAAQAQQHAHASVQAAQQAEELKKTLSVLPDSQHTQHAAATVQNLEARAQAHASITTQVVAQARGMHEKAQAHEKEQLKAITQATVLQAHAQSLQASAVQLEAHVTSTGGPTGSGPTASAEQQMPPVSAPLQSVHKGIGGSGQQPVNSTGMPTGSNGGPLTSADVGPPGGVDPNAMHATTPHSTASGGNVFATIATTQPAPVAMVPAQQMAVPQQVQLVSVPQQGAVVQQASVVQLSAVQADAAALMQHASASAVQQQAAQQAQLYHQQSGEHLAMAAENAALHQQVVVLQAQAANQAAQNAAQHAVQHVQMVAAPPANGAAAPQTRPPVTVQLIAAPGMHRSASHGLLMHAASGSVHMDSNTVQIAAPPQQVAEAPQQQQQQGLVQEPTPSQIAADMGPVVSIPAPATEPVVSGQ